jgi:hypothetical protein
MKVSEGVERKFWDKVMPCGECLIWTGYVNARGYGVFCGDAKRHERAHRISYAIAFGDIPKGKEIDHLCRNKACVCPGHLEAVTHRINVLRGRSPMANNSRATHCFRGHAFTPENTAVRSDGGRACKKCRNARTVAKQKRLLVESDALGIGCRQWRRTPVAERERIRRMLRGDNA